MKINYNSAQSFCSFRNSVLTLIVLVLFLMHHAPCRGHEQKSENAYESTYVGSLACKDCHPEEYENFMTTVTYATIIALRNHQAEKLETLRNAVLNTALSPIVEEDLQHIFLNYIDELTLWHLRVLKFLDNLSDVALFIM